ncbi:MAG: hypothetical protein ACRED6_01935 [Stellaceae bacterium]
MIETLQHGTTSGVLPIMATAGGRRLVPGPLILVPFQLLDFLEFRFDLANGFGVVLGDLSGRTAEQSIVSLDLEPQVISTLGHDAYPKHTPPTCGAIGPARGPCRRLLDVGALAGRGALLDLHGRQLALRGKDREYALPFGIPRGLCRPTQLEGLFPQKRRFAHQHPP